MEQVDVTWARAFKIWWSYSWRACVLGLLVLIPLEALMLWYLKSHLPQQGSNPAAVARVARTLAIAWPILMALVIAAQAQAMRWMLNKAPWSDFHVAVLPHDQ